MTKYTIEISEVLLRTIKVEAGTAAEAIRKVKEAYLRSDIVLDASDYMVTEFRVKDEKTA